MRKWARMVAGGTGRALHVAWWVCAAGTLAAESPASSPIPESPLQITLPAGEVLDQIQPLQPESLPPDSGGANAAVSVPDEQRVIQHRGGTVWPRLSGGSDQRAMQRPADRAGSGPWWDLAPLAIVLGLICGAAWLVKRFMPNRRLLTGSGVVDIVARTPLSAKSSLVLVKLGRKLVLLGVTPDRVTPVTTVEDAEQVAVLLGEVHSQRPESVSRAFADAFSDEAHAYAESPEEAPDRTAGMHVQGLLDKVRALARGQG